jgi:hypothetical protein
VSKQRALRRAVRQAEVLKAQARRERAARRRALLRRLRPGLRRRRSGRLPSGLSRAQLAAIVLGSLGALAFVWLVVNDVSTRLALSAIILLCAPALFVLTADRRT